MYVTTDAINAKLKSPTEKKKTFSNQLRKSDNLRESFLRDHTTISLVMVLFALITFLVLQPICSSNEYKNLPTLTMKIDQAFSISASLGMMLHLEEKFGCTTN